MKHVVSTLCALALVVGLTGAAHAETWKCQYKGRWATEGGSPNGTLGWKLDWNGETTVWAVSGTDRDQYGQSALAGTCEAGSCTIKQVYKDGKLKGIDYIWTGTYTDKALGTGKTENAFTGTWAASDGLTKGTWNAKGNCQLKK